MNANELYEPDIRHILSDMVIREFVDEWEAADRNTVVVQVEVTVNVTVGN